MFGTSEERLRQLTDELDSPPDRLLIRALDLSRPDGAPGAGAAVVDRFGRVDIVLHLIGGWAGGQQVTEVTDDAVAEMLSRHLWSTFYLSRTFVPHLVANRWGRMIAVSSPAASDPPARQLPYVVGKATQEALILTLAKELRGSNVTANLIVVQKIDEEHERDREDGRRSASGTTPEEIVAAILYLCSDEGGVVNGARVPLYRAG